MPRFKNKTQPIYYKSIEEMDKPLSVLMNELRDEVARTRGKLEDMKRAFGYEQRITHLEGGLTCMLMSMYCIQVEFLDFETRQKANNNFEKTNE